MYRLPHYKYSLNPVSVKTRFASRFLRWFAFVAAVALFALSHTLAAAAQQEVQGAGSLPTGPQRKPLVGMSAVPERTYLLRPGDTVSVNLRYTPEFNEDVTIAPDGRAAFRAAGVVDAAGLTLAGLEGEIAHKATTKLVAPEVSVTLKDYDRPHVFVAGEVALPGRQDLRRPTTALQAILMCGGPKEEAAMGRVLLFRRMDADTAEVHVLQLGRYRGKVLSRNDVLLQPDDMLLVRRDLPAHIERYIKLANLGFYLNPLQNVSAF